MNSLTNSDYLSSWRDYRRRRITFWIVFLGGGPFVVLVGAAVTRLSPSSAGVVATWVVWAACFAVSSNRLLRWRCPRCGERFFWAGPIHFGLARRCMHCGLRKWALFEGDEGGEFPW